MDVLQHLGVALGLATLAGVNLYLTVFATSLALHNGWLTLSDQYHDLTILGHPWVLYLSGGLYFLQFFADKVPWVDSLWDLVHTVIRPLGGAFLAIKALGEPNPVFDVIIGLLAGGVALTSHGAKAGTRLLVNGSPEPFSNIAVSLAEDAVVCGGLGVLTWTYWQYPWLALVVFTSVLGTLLYATPRVFRFIRVRLWLFWKKLSSPAADSRPVELARELPSAEADVLFRRENLLGETVAWAAPCLTAGSKGLPANARGWLVATNESPAKLVFVGRCGWRKVSHTLDLSGDYTANREPKFLSENLCLYPTAAGDKRPRHVFIFDRSRSRLVKAIVENLRTRLTGSVAEAPAAGAGSARPELVSA